MKCQIKDHFKVVDWVASRHFCVRIHNCGGDVAEHYGYSTHSAQCSKAKKKRGLFFFIIIFFTCAVSFMAN